MFDLKVNNSNNNVSIVLSGSISSNNAVAVLETLSKEVVKQVPFNLDLSKIDYFDIAAAAVLLEIKHQCQQKKCLFSLVASNQKIDDLLKSVKFSSIKEKIEIIPKANESIFMRLGNWAYSISGDFREMLVFLGDLSLAFLYVFRHPKSIRWKDVLFYLERVGVDAIPITMLIQFLIGITLAFLGASQLKQFGADIFVAAMVALAMVYEIGPLMTGIMVSGRSGAAFAAEIGTMKVSEEVDALVAMGFNPQLFLVVPKVIAVLIAMPGLLMISNVVGIFGGSLVSYSMLKISMLQYYTATYDALTLRAILQGLTKAIAFGFLLSAISCMRGFQVRGGAESVGQYTTSAVVSSIFLIIIANAIFTIIFQIT